MLVILRATGEYKELELCRDFPNLLAIIVNDVVLYRRKINEY